MKYNFFLYNGRKMKYTIFYIIEEKQKYTNFLYNGRKMKYIIFYILMA